jgi:hypothetical protein
MNCKQGDLAIVIGARSFKHQIGRVVTCVRHVPYGFRLGMWKAVDYDVWIVSDSREEWLHSDARLRPIRDNDGEDETLQWAPVPTKETA